MRRWFSSPSFLMFCIIASMSISPAWAEETGKISFQIDHSDLSYQFLGQIFGTIGSVLIGGENGIMPALFSWLNTAVMTIGGLVLGYVTVMSTLNTAQEGEVMGRKWSSVWIPLKSTLGMALLVPAANGYALIQILVMKCIIMGIAAGNSVFHIAIDHAMLGQSMNLSQIEKTIASAQTQMNPSLDSFIEQGFQSAVCAQLLNNNPHYNQSIDGSYVDVYNISPTRLAIGVQGSPDFAEICGYIDAPEGEEDGTAILNAAAMMVDFMINQAQEACLTTDLQGNTRYVASNPDMQQLYWTQGGVLERIKMMYYSAVNQNSVALVNDDTRTALEQARKDGWILAGSYYYRLARPTTEALRATIQDVPTVRFQDDGPGPSSIRTMIKDIANAYYQYARKFEEDLTKDLLIRPKVHDGTQQTMMGLVALLIDGFFAPNEDRPEPLMYIQYTGSVLMVVSEGLIVLTLIATLASFTPIVGMMFLEVMLLLVVPLMMLFIYLWSFGAYLALYIPMIPPMMYLFTALAWLLLCLEAMLASPLIALRLSMPSQGGDFFGREGQVSLLMLLNLALRPALTVAGFIAGSRLFVIAMYYLQYGFRILLKEVFTDINSFTLFGTIVFLSIYVGLITTIVNKTFGLIHILPDRVIRWIGGQPEQSSVTQDMQSMRQDFDSQTQKTQEAMRGMGILAKEKMRDTRDRRLKEQQNAQDLNKVRNALQSQSGASASVGQAQQNPLAAPAGGGQAGGGGQGGQQP